MSTDTPMTQPPLISARGVSVSYPIPERRRWGRRAGASGSRYVHALSDVNLDILCGETLAVVGESGSGKSTLARVLLRTVKGAHGQVSFGGADLTRLTGGELRSARRQFQMVFQDPYSSLNPRLSVGSAIAEPLVVHRLAGGRALRDRVSQCLRLVGLDPAVASRRPHEFSGGERQRICIARAIAAEPQFIVADEALSALDMSLQSQMLDLFEDLKQRLGLTYLFISHDLGVVRQIADRVAVMYLGRIVELASVEALYARALHPYTQALVAAVPTPDPAAERSRVDAPLRGGPPSPADPPLGCHFHTRCPYAVALCRNERPALVQVAHGHLVACHLAPESPWRHDEDL